MPNSSQSVLALTLGEDNLASSRVRISAALSSLDEEGCPTAKMSAASRTWPVAFVVRLLVTRPAVTIVQKVAPPGWFSKVIASLSRRLVFECDDAIQLGYGMDSVDAERISRRLRTLLPLCDSIIVSNALLGEDFRKLGGGVVIVFPGPAPAIALRREEGRHGILWLGSPSTLKNVQSIVYPALEFLPEDISLTVVGGTRNCEDGRVRELIWSYGAQTRALSRARVGVAPQVHDAWSRRKAFYKVLEYLAASVVPVVPDHPAVSTLLGEELNVVAVVARDDTPAAWAAAIMSALKIEIDEQWIAARDRIFTRWSPNRLGRVMLG